MTAALYTPLYVELLDDRASLCLLTTDDWPVEAALSTDRRRPLHEVCARHGQGQRAP